MQVANFKLQTQELGPSKGNYKNSKLLAHAARLLEHIFDQNCLLSGQKEAICWHSKVANYKLGTL